MANRTFEYHGERIENHGKLETYAPDVLTDEKLERLKSKGWTEVKKGKPKKKKKKS